MQLKIIEKNDDSTTIKLSNVVKNTAIDAGLFNLKLPKGVKIVNKY